MSKPNNQPPSRQRWAAAHPTIGVHVDVETYAKLVELRQRSGLSFSQLVRQTLGVVEMDVATVEGSSFERGWEEGYAEAQARYALTIACSVCGQFEDIEADSEAGKVAAAALARLTWGHAKCPKGVPRQR